jgi:hypothetical protein
MGKNGASDPQDNIVKLGQWEFHTVQEGLDKNQVATLLEELSRERDQLIERTEHLNSLTRLAEKTVTEADKLAEQTLNDAIAQSQQEADRIVGTAKDEAQKQREEIKQLQTDFNNSVRGLLSQLLTGLDGFSQQVKDLATEIEKKLPEADAAETVAVAEAPEPPEAVQPADEPPPEAEAPAAEEAAAAPPAESEAADNELLYELQIMPPLDVMKIMDVVTYLDNMPEVKNTELIPNTERPSIMVELNEKLPLAEMLRTLPELDSVEDSDGELSEDNRRIVRIGLAETPVPQETT